MKWGELQLQISITISQPGALTQHILLLPCKDRAIETVLRLFLKLHTLIYDRPLQGILDQIQTHIGAKRLAERRGK